VLLLQKTISDKVLDC